MSATTTSVFSGQLESAHDILQQTRRLTGQMLAENHALPCLCKNLDLKSLLTTTSAPAPRHLFIEFMFWISVLFPNPAKPVNPV